MSATPENNDISQDNKDELLGIKPEDHEVDDLVVERTEHAVDDGEDVHVTKVEDANNNDDFKEEIPSKVEESDVDEMDISRDLPPPDDETKKEDDDEDLEDAPQQEEEIPEQHAEEYNDEDDQNKSGSEKDIEEDVYKLKRHKKAVSEMRAATVASLPVQKTRPRKHRPEDEELENARNAKRAKSTSAPPEGDDVEDDDDGIRDDQEEEEEQMDEETRRRKELQLRIKNAGAQPKKKSRKANEESLDMYQDELVNQLRNEMRKVAIADAECVRNSQPAINKLKMLPKVTSIIRKGALADTILDNNLLESVRIWLEPLPDASLPAYQIQKELFDALETLPIKTVHLRESGLGRVVIFYQRSKRPQLNIKRAVDRLVGNWTRPIMGRSDNYRDKMIRTSNYNVQSDEAYKKRSVAATQSAMAADQASAAASRRNRAMIPMNKPVYYEVAPKSVITQNAAARSRGGNTENYRRMTQKLMSKKAATRKSGMSIEGR